MKDCNWAVSTAEVMAAETALLMVELMGHLMAAPMDTMTVALMAGMKVVWSAVERVVMMVGLLDHRMAAHLVECLVVLMGLMWVAWRVASLAVQRDRWMAAWMAANSVVLL